MTDATTGIFRAKAVLLDPTIKAPDVQTIKAQARDVAGNYGEDELEVAYNGDGQYLSDIKIISDPPAATLDNAQIQFTVYVNESLISQLPNPVRIETSYGDGAIEYHSCDFTGGSCALPGLHSYSEARVYQAIVNFPDQETDQVGIGLVDIEHPFKYKTFFSTSDQGIYPLDLVGDPKEEKYYVLGATSSTAAKATLLYQYELTDGELSGVSLLRDAVAEHPGEDWWIAGAEASLEGNTVSLRWAEVSADNGGRFLIMEGPPFTVIAGCSSDCLEAGVADIRDFHVSSAGRVSLATMNGAPVILTYGDTSARTVAIQYDTGNVAPVIYEAAVNENDSLFLALKFYSDTAGTEVFGHSNFSADQPVNETAYTQAVLASAPKDFCLASQTLAFWCPDEHVIYRLNDRSELLESIQGLDEITPSTLGSKGGIDLFRRKWKTCLTFADTENQRVIEWEMDPSEWPGNPGEVFQKMLLYLEKQNVEAAISCFAPNVRPNFSYVFYSSIDSLPQAADALGAKLIFPVSIRDNSAQYAIVFEKDDGAGGKINVLSDVVFINAIGGKWLIAGM